MQRVALDVAAVHAAEVDARARFPQETLDALRASGLMAVGIPRELGGIELPLHDQARLCATLAQACGSSGMVYAMHLIQIACLSRHRDGQPALDEVLRTSAQQQWLLGSMTSEVGTWGDTRSSICALQNRGTRVGLEKRATTGSYGAQADAILVTCRLDEASPASDQRLVLVRAADCTLTQTDTWDTLGMRGTVSPGFLLQAEVDPEQVLQQPYADISAVSMVPYSHVLWSALWWGIAADATAKASACVRTAARQKPGQTPPAALRLAELSARLQAARLHWVGVAREVDEQEQSGPAGRQALAEMGWRLRFNHLKTQMSEAVPQLVHEAMQVIGMPAYKNDTPYSLGRHYRDALSGSLMINNDRIAAGSAALLTVHKEG